MTELQHLAPRPETHEIRVRFATRASLVAGLARAQREPWVERARIDLPSHELILAMAGGGGHTRHHLHLVPEAAREGAAA
ncbi:MAG: hypothetical protein GY946_00380 [bacterium]|nr:hypothetical protein [bacterium]